MYHICIAPPPQKNGDQHNVDGGDEEQVEHSVQPHGEVEIQGGGDQVAQGRGDQVVHGGGDQAVCHFESEVRHALLTAAHPKKRCTIIFICVTNIISQSARN